MKRWMAGVLTVLLMAGLLWSGSRRAPLAPRLSSPDANEQPSRGAEDRIRALLECTVQGDVSGYLNSFGGALRQRLEREVTERGRDAFAADLRRAASARKSHAIFAGEADPRGDVKITVETVYPDRNERQVYRLERDSTTWLVTDAEIVRSHEPKAKYGTPAAYKDPEGVPVQPGIVVESGSDRGNAR